MPLSPAEETLVEAANRAIDAAVPPGTVPQVTKHTVGSAARCSDGRIFTGINVYHFSGGPCAENIALANAAAAGVASALSSGVGDGARLTTIVAVTNDERGVISPCGRCRQMMLDYYPDIRVIVRDGEELRTVSVKELLPFAYMPIYDD